VSLSGASPGIGAAIDVAEVTRVVKSGLRDNLLCSRCEEIIRHDVRTERGILQREAGDEAPRSVLRNKETWWRKVLARRQGWPR